MTMTGPLHILFADNDLAATRPVRVELRRRSAEVDWVGTSEEAGQNVRLRAPDVLVLDAGLENIGDSDPVSYFSEHLPDTEMILLYSGQGPTPHGSGLGLLFSAQKPVSKSALMEVIDSAFPGRLSEANAASPEPHSILCVDDDPAYLHSLSRFLERRGYRIHGYENASDALEALPGIRPDLAIVDIMMPGMDGLTLTRRIGESSKGSVPIVVLTALSSKEIYRRARENGASYCLIKPIKPEDLLNVVDFIAGDLDSYERSFLKSRLNANPPPQPQPS